MGAADAGRPGDFPGWCDAGRRSIPPRAPAIARALFAVRWKAGALLGWDDAGDGLGARVPTLRDRLPADLRDTPAGAAPDALPFAPLYLTDTGGRRRSPTARCTGCMHLGWVADGGRRPPRPDGDPGEAQRPAGTAYMAAIAPFRHVLVYPPMLREIGRRWRAQDRGAVMPNG